MAQRSECGDEVRRRQRIQDDQDELGRFAHRLSLDVTNEALNFAAMNGVGQDITSSGTNDPSERVLNEGHPQSLPTTPDCNFRLSDHDISYEDCKKRKHRSQSSTRNPVGRIRDVSRSIAKWLRIKSKSINGLDGACSETHQEHSWRLWGKFGKRNDPRKRALPPVPIVNNVNDNSHNFRLNFTLPGLMPGDAYMPDEDDDDEYEHDNATSFDYNGQKGNIDFAASIEKVKDYGWYWGPISGEAAEMLLMNEPDGSFVVRDSSDSRYIFSLTFKLHGTIRHVRIEHNQGNFSFGSFTKFKSNTIVDFIENAVEHSRSGRYLFFLHRRPVFGPMQVQLLHPVSRFKQVQSLQHLSRFVILKLVPRDLLSQLPVPKRIQVYLDTPFYYSEAVADWTKDSEQQEPQSNSELESPPSQTQAPPPLDDLSARPYEHEP